MRVLAAWVGVVVAATLYANGWRTDNRLANWAGQFAEDDTGYRLLHDRFGGDEVIYVRSPRALPLDTLPAVRQVADPAKLPPEVVAALDLRRHDYLLLIDPDASPEARHELARRLGDLGPDVRAAGHPLVAAALDEEAARVERVFAPLLALLAFLCVALLVRSWALGALALLPAVSASAGSRAVLRLLGIDSDLILVAVGPLTFVLLLASTLHLVLAFQRRYAAGEERVEAARHAYREKIAAGLLAAVTTAVGFGVFAFCRLRSVALLGGTVAVTMLVCVPLVYALLPALLARLPLRRSRPRLQRSWRRLAAWGIRRRYAVVVLPLCVLAFCTWPRTETNALHYFPQDHAVRRDFVALETEGVGLSSVEVLVHGWEGKPLARRLARVEGVTGVFGPEHVPPLAAVWAGRRSGAWSRWTVRFPTRDAEWTNALIEAVRQQAGPALVTGSVPLLFAMQQELTKTLAQSLLWTFLVTSLLFLLVARHPISLCAAMLTNLVPTVALLAVTAMFDIPLDSATVMTAAVVLGLAVDNTFHIMHAAGKRPGPRDCLRAFDRVGPAAAVSSLALVLGFSTLALSGFAPTARFGLLCAVGSACALLADLVILPALWTRRY